MLVFVGYRTENGTGIIMTCREVTGIRDLFHVYLNRCEFHFLRLDINITNIFYFLIKWYGQINKMAF